MGKQDFGEEKIEPRVLTRLAEHAQRAGKTINELLADMLEERECLNRQQEKTTEKAHVTTDEWSLALRAWAETHPVRGVLADDSRESIYEGRGE